MNDVSPEEIKVKYSGFDNMCVSYILFVRKRKHRFTYMKFVPYPLLMFNLRKSTEAGA